MKSFFTGVSRRLARTQLGLMAQQQRAPRVQLAQTQLAQTQLGRTQLERLAQQQLGLEPRVGREEHGP